MEIHMDSLAISAIHALARRVGDRVEYPTAQTVPY
jgi:hypothetical protein